MKVRHSPQSSVRVNGAVVPAVTVTWRTPGDTGTERTVKAGYGAQFGGGVTTAIVYDRPKS